MDIDRLIASASRPRRSVSLCLRGDLVARIEQVDERIAGAKRRRRNSMAQEDTASLEAERDALVEEAKAATVEFVLEGPPRSVVRQLMVDNPARDGDDDDRRAGYNRDAFSWGLLRAGLVEPELTDDQFVSLFGPEDSPGGGVLSAGQWGKIDQALAEVAYGGTSVPF